jgi:hypothetical protein
MPLFERMHAGQPRVLLTFYMNQHHFTSTASRHRAADVHVSETSGDDSDGENRKPPNPSLLTGSKTDVSNTGRGVGHGR